MGKILKIVFVAILLLAVVGGYVVYSGLKTDIVDKPIISKPVISYANESESKTLILKEEYFTYILNEIGAYELHNSPLSSDKPRIKFDVDGEIFTSEIEDNKIETRKGDFGNEDLKFLTTKEEVINAIDSDDMGEYFINSIKQGNSGFEIKADKKTLFLKGYLGLYKKLTGKDISVSGAVISVLRG